MVKVTYAIESLDPNPTVVFFDNFNEAEDWLHEEVSRRVDHIVKHAQTTIEEDELDYLFENEYSLVRIETVE